MGRRAIRWHSANDRGSIMSTPNPVPSYFSFRYILWLAWTHAVGVLSAIQAIFGAVLLAVDANPEHPVVSQKIVLFLLVGNAALTGILSQINRNSRSPVDASKTPLGDKESK